MGVKGAKLATPGYHIKVKSGHFAIILGQRSSDVLKAASYLVYEGFGLFESGEMSTFFEDFKVNEIGEALACPALRGAEDLFWKDGTADGYINRVSPCATETLPVNSRRRCTGVGKPIHHDIVEQFVS